jgi:hypothetical protein
VWPCNYRSDLFEIDDLNAFADAFGIPRPDDHKHKITWKLSQIDDGHSAYARVNIVFECGCDLHQMGIKKFALDLNMQKGWVIATSTGFSSHSDGKTTEYTISVKRNSLK